jgi:cell wall-associated NlpC family hydrolase
MNLHQSITANGTINVSVSSHYSEPSYASEVTSQGILGERVEILEHHPLFSRIRQADGYESWISTDQVYRGEIQGGKEVIVRSHFVVIHREPSTSSEGVRDAVIGSTLIAVDERENWYRIALPDCTAGWAEKRHFGTFPGFSVENILSLAREFLGYQYAWGGRSPKGFDCSGFVQTVFSLHGIVIARDSWQQQQGNLLSTDYRQAQPADLLFFGKTPERVTHVAISLGDQRFIHASGWIRCNSFRKTDLDYSSHHLQTFISVNRYGD